MIRVGKLPTHYCFENQSFGILLISHSIFEIQVENIMDGLTKNPGLQYVAEEIFLNLNLDTIEKCMQVNESWRKILINPSFWLRKCTKYGKIVGNKLDWEKTDFEV